MIRLGALVWLMLVVAAGFVTFKVKYAVQDIEDELNRVRKQTVAEQQEIRVLNAEWTYLNQPERLAELNRRFLQWGPIAAKQLQGKIDDIPFRPLPPPLPLPTPDILVAAAPAAPPPQPATAIEPATATATEIAPTPTPEPSPVAVAAAPPAAAPVPASAASALASLGIGQASAGELPGASAAIKPAAMKPATPVQLAKASAARQPRSLDDLFSQIAEAR
jgi:cell division protein FtsL